MKENHQRCQRCLGRKKIYKVGAGYTLTNSGGKEVNCPDCQGEGSIAKIESQVEQTEDTRKYKKERTNGRTAS